MNQLQIDALLTDYNISKEELDAREGLVEFAHSLSSTVVDEFVGKHLINNPNLSVYLAHIDADRLVKNIKKFVAFVLTAPIDEEYIKRVHSIGSIHYTIKLHPSKVSYGFWAIDDILNRLSRINEVVKKNRSLISKILRLVENSMRDGYDISKEKEYLLSIEELQGYSFENELSIGLNKHKDNLKKLQKAAESDDFLDSLESIETESSSCEFGKILSKFQKNDNHKHLLGSFLEEVINLHNEWHFQFVNFQDAVTQKNRSNTALHLKSLENITQEISGILDKILKSSLDDGKLALDSGIRSMKYMTNILSSKDMYSDFNKIFENSVVKTLNEFTWAIENISVSFEILEIESYTIMKLVRHDAKNAYIGIKLKQEHDNGYIKEMINMLLEVLELHFTIKDREKSLISFADKAESANKSKDMFLANMSHELRTPINAITGFSQILMRKKDIPEKTKEYIQKINIAGNNLLELVNTILDFAKLEAGKMQFNPKINNVSNILNEVNTLIEPIALKKDIDYAIAKIVSLNLYVDNKLIKQVLINLLTNAIKFTPNGGKVELTVEFNYEKHSYIFKVKDSGIGISKDGISKLFQAFTQVDDSYAKQEQGTGLGLMISKKIIEDLHKGKIWVESVEGEGSTFYVELPTPAIKSHTYKVQEAPVGAKNLLIAEDSKHYQNILIENLKNTHNLTITDSVNRAKQLILENEYDFLILDFFLVDGISSEILQFMEEEGISVQSMIISAEDEINISSSLAGSSNLEGIMNKNNIEAICGILKRGAL